MGRAFVQMTATVEEDLASDLAVLARIQGRSRSAVIRDALRAFLRAANDDEDLAKRMKMLERTQVSSRRVSAQERTSSPSPHSLPAAVPEPEDPFERKRRQIMEMQARARENFSAAPLSISSLAAELGEGGSNDG